MIHWNVVFLLPVCSFSFISYKRCERTITFKQSRSELICFDIPGPASNDEKSSLDTLSYLFNESEDDDDDDDDAIVSPFLSNMPTVPLVSNESVTDVPMALTVENVDVVLNEVRPYLVADGGNVAVKRVDEANGTVYLKLEGACGSCPSSTVTMKMGIERVLKENFPNFKEVLEVDDDAQDQNSIDAAVKKEMNRLSPAISAMGGKMELVGTDIETGVVTIQFRGSNKVRQGLELALLDLPSVNKVDFVMGND